jgi:hypothetical protein
MYQFLKVFNGAIIFHNQYINEWWGFSNYGIISSNKNSLRTEFSEFLLLLLKFISHRGWEGHLLIFLRERCIFIQNTVVFNSIQFLFLKKKVWIIQIYMQGVKQFKIVSENLIFLIFKIFSSLKNLSTKMSFCKNVSVVWPLLPSLFQYPFTIWIP